MLDADQGTCGDDTDDAIRAPVVLDDGYRQLQTTAQTVKDTAKKKKMVGRSRRHCFVPFRSPLLKILSLTATVLLSNYANPSSDLLQILKKRYKENPIFTKIKSNLLTAIMRQLITTRDGHGCFDDDDFAAQY